MKVKRQKHARKALAFYKNSFGMFEPYQILVDATFCQAAITAKIHIKDGFDSYFDAQNTLYTTPCVVEEVRKLGPNLAGAYIINRKYEHRRCGHKPGEMTARDCVKSVIGEANRFKLMVATQDAGLRKELREIPCCPLLYIDYHAIILEAPSPATLAAAQKINHDKMGVSEKEAKALNLNITPVEPLVKHTYKKPKAPNPLSCRKKKGEEKKKLTKKKGKKQKREKMNDAVDIKEGETATTEAAPPTESTEITDVTAVNETSGTKRVHTEIETEPTIEAPKKKHRGKRGKKKSSKGPVVDAPHAPESIAGEDMVPETLPVPKEAL